MLAGKDSRGRACGLHVGRHGVGGVFPAAGRRRRMGSPADPSRGMDPRPAGWRGNVAAKCGRPLLRHALLQRRPDSAHVCAAGSWTLAEMCEPGIVWCAGCGSGWSGSAGCLGGGMGLTADAERLAWWVTDACERALQLLADLDDRPMVGALLAPAHPLIWRSAPPPRLLRRFLL